MLPRALLAAVLGALVFAAPAHAISSFTAYSEVQRYGGYEPPIAYSTAAGDTITASGDTNGGGVSLMVSPADGSRVRDYGISGPAGPLTPGVHTGDKVVLNGPDCDPTRGSYDVRDIAYDDYGNVTRAWITFVQDCYPRGDVFGELRYDEPGQTAPGIVQWGSGDPGYPRVDVPVQVFGDVTSAAVSGGAFSIAGQSCAGGRCVVTVHDAGAPGQSDGMLRLALADGSEQTVPLSGFAYGGRIEWDVSGEPGEPYTRGQSLVYRPPVDSVAAEVFVDTGLAVHVGGADGTAWVARFFPPPGQAFAVGSYAATNDVTSHRTQAGLDISSTIEPSSCDSTSTFDIEQLTYLPDGRLETLALIFTLQCQGATGALHGRILWRADDGSAAAQAAIGSTAARGATWPT